MTGRFLLFVTMCGIFILDSNALWAVLSPTIWWICEVIMGARTYTFSRRNMKRLRRLTIQARKGSASETLRAALYALDVAIQKNRIPRNHLKEDLSGFEERDFRFDSETVKKLKELKEFLGAKEIGEVLIFSLANLEQGIKDGRIKVE